MMLWHDITDPQDPLLDKLAVQYNLHPLHVEDCRHRNQSPKMEYQNGYLFIVLKPIEMDEECLLQTGDVDFFLGKDYLITVQESHSAGLAEAITRIRPNIDKTRPDQLLYRLMDGLVDSYYPVLDRLIERIDTVEDDVLESPNPQMLERILDLRRAIIEFRRVLANTRDVVGNLQRQESGLIAPDLMPFLRDVYDHIARGLDHLEVQRDLLTGATEIYLSSVANQTNQVMKVLTVFGTLATPALVITGIYGMNLQHLPFAGSPYASTIVTALILGVSILLLVIFKRYRWL